MAEYIDRKSLGIGRCNPNVFEKKGYAEGWNSAIEIIMDAPTADVIEVKHGQWLPQRLLGKDIVDCSECKTIGSPQWGWCPVCGAKMAAKIKQQEAVSLVDGHIDKSNRCVSCGAEIPDGTWTCPSCDRRWG